MLPDEEEEHEEHRDPEPEAAKAPEPDPKPIAPPIPPAPPTPQAEIDKGITDLVNASFDKASADWLNDLRKTPLAQNTPAWNALRANLPNFKAHLQRHLAGS